MVKVYIDEHIDDFDLEEALAQISQQRREQALRFKFEHGQRTCVLAYLLLKKALLEQYGIQENPVFEYGEHGKPSIVGHPEIFFNLSHCREAVACVIGDGPVGIDVESLGRYRESVARYAMNEEELAEIQSSGQPDITFTRLWTMKEAALKLSGVGLRDDMRNVLQGNVRIVTTEVLDKGYIYSVAS